MVQSKVYCFLLSSLLCVVGMQVFTMHAYDTEQKFVVVTASYNNRDWYQNNLNSVFEQKYDNYRIIYIDDCSSDGTAELVEQYAKEKGEWHRMTLIKNNKRRLAMENLYHAIHSCDDREIIVILDGDDWLAHDQVFSYLNMVYEDPSVWITYGQFSEYPYGTRGFNQPIPDHVVQSNSFRTHYNAYSHLRTFYASLFKKIKKKDLMYEKRFVPMCYDVAMMMPMMEMAGENHRFIPDILYVYNGSNVINDHKISKKRQRYFDLYVRGKLPYKKIPTL